MVRSIVRYLLLLSIVTLGPPVIQNEAGPAEIIDQTA
jgi:hypothetical protein